MEEKTSSPAGAPPAARGGVFKLLDVATAKFDALRSPSPKHEEVASSSPGRQSSRSRTASRTVEVEAAPVQSQRDGSDEGEKDDVIRLLKQCLAAAQQEEENLKQQIDRLQKDVDYWKKESYGGIQKSLSDIAHSPQYQDLKEKLKQEKLRVAQAEQQLAEAIQEKKAMEAREQEFRSHVEQARAATAAAEAVVASERSERAEERAKMEREREREHAEQARQRQEASEERAKLLRDRDEALRLREEARIELKKLTEEMAVAKKERDEARSLLEDVRARSERETGGEAEFQCLLRDRELLSSQLLEAQRRLKELENKPEEKKKERREVMLPPPVETQSLLVAPLTPADLALQKKFGLPESERQIAVHGGTFLQQHGFVYLSDEHICFGGSAVKSFFEKKDLIIALKNVAAIDKTGSKSHVKIVLKDGTCHDFSGIRHRKLFAVQVRTAGAKLGAVAIEILREGQPDLKSGVLPDLQEDDFLLV